MLLYAMVNGQKTLPSRGERGTCLHCGGDVLAKCGSIRVHHWAHRSGRDCDTWSEGIGPWHLWWQGQVRPEFVEVPVGRHRADILGSGNLVIELQHSAISPEAVRERETHYGAMLWLIDAIKRFGGLVSGSRFFFSFGRTRHFQSCNKPVVLDFADFLVEVEAIDDVIPGFSGFGVIRDPAWFFHRYLADRLAKEAPQREKSAPKSLSLWASSPPWKLTRSLTQWRHPSTGLLAAFASGMPYIPLHGRSKSSKWPAWWDVISRYPVLANGWTQSEMRQMIDLLGGTPVLLDGCLRLLPSIEEVKISVGESVLAELLSRMDGHVMAGRMPVIDERRRHDLITQSRGVQDSIFGSFLTKLANGRGHRRWTKGVRQ